MAFLNFYKKLFSDRISNFMEKRKSVRWSTHMLLKYRTPGQDKKITYVKNISAGGVLFHSREKIEPDSVLELEINFPRFPHAVRVKVDVVWARLIKRMGEYEVGTRFLDIDKEEKEFIKVKILSVHGRSKEKEKAPELPGKNEQ